MDQLHALREKAVPRGIYNAHRIFVQEARGAKIVDLDGKSYIDFASGIGTVNVGHSHPEVVKAIQEQASRFLHTCFHVAMYEPYVALANLLNRSTPGSFPKKTMLTNSGAEAVENAVKISRAFTKRKAIVCFECGFHGRTYLGMSLTSKVRPYKIGFGPFLPEIYRLPYPYPYRCPTGGSQESCGDACFQFLERFFVTHVDPDEVACIIAEPVAGEGGFIVPPHSYMKALAAFCQEHGILLVADEVQTGFARTGKLFASEHFNWEPDLLVMAKSLAAGLPLGAVTGKGEVMDAPSPGGLGGTFGGNPLSCVAALKVLEIIQKEHLIEKAAKIGKIIMERFQTLQERFPLIGEIRGLGAMCALELVKDRKTKEPAQRETQELIQEAARKGLILFKAGIYDNVIRLLPPLVLPEDLLAEGLDLLQGSLQAAVQV